MSARINISSGAPWEDVAGYSRAVRVGNTITVAGTTAVDEHGKLVGAGDLYEQTRFIFAKIERALQQAGAGLSDVVLTRSYLVDMGQWQEFARAHHEVFGDIRPAATAIEIKGLIDPDMLIEIEVMAIIIS